MGISEWWLGFMAGVSSILLPAEIFLLVMFWNAPDIEDENGKEN